MQNNDKSLDKLLDLASKKTGANREALRSAVSGGDINKVLFALNSADAEKLKNALQNKAETEKLLRSEQAQELIRKLSGGK